MANKTNNTLFNWPSDAEGNPLSLISISVSELIPTAKYANVTLGPATITKFTEEGNEQQAIDAAYQSVDEVLQKHHDLILEELEAGNS